MRVALSYSVSAVETHSWRLPAHPNGLVSLFQQGQVEISLPPPAKIDFLVLLARECQGVMAIGLISLPVLVSKPISALEWGLGNSELACLAVMWLQKQTDSQGWSEGVRNGRHLALLTLKSNRIDSMRKKSDRGLTP
jgi:hypothetical protein